MKTVNAKRGTKILHKRCVEIGTDLPKFACGHISSKVLQSSASSIRAVFNKLPIQTPETHTGTHKSIHDFRKYGPKNPCSMWGGTDVGRHYF